MRRRTFCRVLGAAALMPMPLRAQAKYPDRPIRLVVPYAPGGVVDVVARQFAERAKTSLGNVVIENQGGAGGTTGAAAVARAQADGYTLLFGDTSSQVIAPQVMGSAPYDPAKDFTAIAMIATSSTAVVVHPDVPAKTFPEFIAYAKAQGGKLSYATAGAGTVTHVAGELFKQLVGTPDIVHVPYRGAGPGFTDLLAGVVPMMTPNITGQILEMHRAGRVRILAVCAPARLKAAPDIPAAAETLPGLVVQLTCGVLGPAGLPAPVVAAVSGAAQEAVKDAAFVAALEKAGLEARPDASPAAAQSFLEAERTRLAPIIKAAGMKA